MKTPTYNLNRFTVSSKEEFTLVSEELSKYYGKPLYWLPWKHDIRKIKTAFLELQKEGDKTFSHLMQKLR